MQAETVESELSRRVAALSPVKRAILQRLMSSATETSVAEEIPLQERGSRRDFPLSSAQERMWFNHQWSPAEPLYNESFGLVTRGPLNLDLLGRSFDLVMERHEIFTTTFHSEQGRLFQRIGSGIAPKMKVSDIRNLGHDERERAFETESRMLLREPFDLEKGPLFRAGAWRIDEQQTRLIFAMHHIIFDGRSGGIFLGELLAAYAALAQGQRPELPPIGAQYVDFAVWEQSRSENSAELDQQAEYWRSRLANAPDPPVLPVDRHASDSRVHAAGREAFACPPAATAALKTLASDSGATLFMALLAIFDLLLARYSGQEDILVGVPTTNRNQDALRDMVGVFINTAILRTDLSGDISYRELLGRVRKTTLGAQANQELPLQRVLRLLDTPADQGRFLIRVLFDLQNKSAPAAQIPGLSLEPLDIDNGRAKFDLVLAFEETDSELKGILDYDAEKFETETARQLVRHYLALMEAAVSQPDVPANRLPILTADEIFQTTLRGLDTAGQPQPLAVAETIAHARQHPRDPALADGNSSLSYGEMHARALRLALHLRQKGVVPDGVGQGEHIALFLPAGPDLVVAQFAAMMIGAAFVPIDPSYPKARIEFMLQDSGARFAIVNGQTRASFPVPSMVIDSDRDCPPLSAHEKPSETRLPSGDDPAYLIYTSGSTGQPKGVSVSHAALANLIAWHRRVFEISGQDCASQIASVAFDASIWEIWPYLASGASVHFASRELATDPAALRDWIVKQKITVAFAPTPLAEEIIALPWPPKSKLRILLTGGDRLRKSPPAGLPFALINNYGPTENTVVATSGLAAPSAGTAPPTIGRPIDNVWTRIVDRNLEPVPLGGIGELVVGGRSLASGYWNQPDLTAEKFIALGNGERIYRTGDLCRLRRDGQIEFAGRMDTQVKLRGYRIELGEVENALLELPDVRNAAAAVREFPNGQKGIVAYVAVKDCAVTAEKLRTQLGGRLAGYMIPASFVLVDSLPTTPSGKIDREKLPPLSAQAASSRSRILPRTDTEREIAAIWKVLLHVDSVGTQDDFFALGGDSLLATRFAARIRETFSVELPLSRMIAEPNIEALARFIDGAHPGIDKLPEGLILLRPASAAGGPPLFLAPPASGSPACYLGLADALPGGGAVYGLEAPGLTMGPPIASVARQAQTYIAAMDRVYPRGSCFLGGWSVGGAVAFEMARRFRAAGRKIDCLALIDAGLPENGRLPGGASMMTPLWWAISYPFVERVPLNYRTFRMLAQWMGIPLPESPRDIWRRGLIGGSRFAVSLAANTWRSLRVFRANVHAFRTYRPDFFNGNVVLFRTAQGAQLEKSAEAVQKSLGRWCRKVEIHEAPGSHMTLMLDPKINSVFAASLGATLSAAVQNTNESEEREFHATASF